jgi:fatty acid desaturase
MNQTTPPFSLKASELKPLLLRSDGFGVRQAFGHLGAISLTGTALWYGLGTWAVPLTVLHGYFLAFLFSAEHEAAHQTAFRTRAFNYWLGHFAALVLLLPYEYYRAFHWDHHRFTQDAERDPELARILPTSYLSLAWIVSGIPTWRDRLQLLFKHGLLGRVDVPWVPANKRVLIVYEARCYLAVYAVVALVSVFFHSLVAVWLWVLPVVVGHLFLRPYLLAEHTGCSDSTNMLENTRTTYTNAFVRFFAWNMPFHAEHHAYPAVPFYALPVLNVLLAEHTTNSPRGYLASAAAVLRKVAIDRRIRSSHRAPI